VLTSRRFSPQCDALQGLMQQYFG